MGWELSNLSELERAHDRLLAETERAIAESLGDAGRHAVEHVNLHPEFRPHTGNLQKHTKARVVRTSGGRILRIINDAAYAAAIDGGSKAHIIRPTGRGPRIGGPTRLRFFSKKLGHWVSVREVHHPGTKPYRFLYYATDAANRVFRADIERRMADLASRF